MPRTARKVSSTGIYHVVIKGLDGVIIFEETKDYLKFLDILNYQKESCDFKLFAYCLMSNHVHLLIHVCENPIDRIFRKINTTYATWFNMKYNRTGTLLDGRYFSEPVNDERYFLSVLRYIHSNPLHANLEATLGEQYPWNSYRDYVNCYRDSDNSHHNSNNSHLDSNNSHLDSDNCYCDSVNPINELIDYSKALNCFPSISDFQEFHQITDDIKHMDADKFRKRIPDDVASDIICQHCSANNLSGIQDLSLLERRNLIFVAKEKGIGIRQLNRLTGIPVGIIERVLRNRI